jgi:TctA family transporter
MAPLSNSPRCMYILHIFMFIHSSFIQSIVQVTLVCISGYVLARRGILDKSTQKVISFILSSSLAYLTLRN